MAGLPEDIVELVQAEKTLGRKPVWDTKSDDRYHVFTAPLIVVGNEIANFQLRAKTSKRFVDRDALCQLEYSPTARTTVPLWRCEWLPLGLHQNKKWGPKGFELATLRGTHEHRFDDNWIVGESRLRAGNLEGARPITEPISTLSTFLAFAGVRFNIIDIDRIEPPLITQDLFWMQDD